MSLRSVLKTILFRLQIPLTTNIRYDIYTRKIMKRILRKDTNTIDIGCHKGEILDEILIHSPEGRHFAFEPLPHLFSELKEKYRGREIFLSDIALFDKKGTTTFQHVINDPAFSGIRKRKYDKEVQIDELTVNTDLLDNIIPEEISVGFIKIDVEGAEYPVIKGGVKTLKRSKPYIIFECGLGAADYYDTSPEQMYSLLTEDCGLKIRRLRGFLQGLPPLTVQQFAGFFKRAEEYYFIASPE